MQKVVRKAFWSVVGVGLMAIGLTMGAAPSQAGVLVPQAPAQIAPVR